MQVCQNKATFFRTYGYETLPLKRTNFKIMTKMSKANETLDKAQNGNDFIADVSGSLLVRSLRLLEEMCDNHEADAVPICEQHYREVKKLIKEIRKSKRF